MTRVLIADDSPASRQQVAAILSAVENTIISFAANGAEALQLMANETYDLLLCDIEMPILNGIQLVAVVRPTWPHCAAIRAHTASSSFQLSGYLRRSQARSAGPGSTKSNQTDAR
jgi:CheY-like chemotaxis protein